MKPILLIALIALSLPAFAQDTSAPYPRTADATSSPTPPQGQRARVRFVDADTDHDGRLSRSEAQAMPMVARHFDQIDANGDGYITRDELKAARGRMQANRIQRRPANGQGGQAAPPQDPGVDGMN
jgi:cell division septation protein DedD